MKTKCLVFLSFLFISALPSFGQSGSSIGEIEDVSASNLLSAKSAGVNDLSNVDLFTGRVSPNVPLFNKKVDNIGFSLDLNYSSNGFKPQELVGQYGLGWDLSNGYKISRVINGTPDDVEQFTIGAPSVRNNKKGFWNSSFPNLTMSKTDKKNYVLDNHDSEIDFFFLSLNGRNVKFVIGKNRVAVPLNDDQVKIEFVIDSLKYSFFQYKMEDNSISYTPGSLSKGIVKFIVTDESGTKYYFESQNRIHKIANARFTHVVLNPPGPNPGPPYFVPSSLQIEGFFNADEEWELTQIETPNKNQINLQYGEPVFQIIPSKPTNMASVNSSDDCYHYPGNIPGSSAYHPYDDFLRIYYVIRILHPLKKVVFPDGVNVDFSYKERAACAGTTTVIKNHLAIDKIDIKVDNAVKYGYKFNHSYFDKNGSGLVSAYNTCIDGVRYFQDDLNKRLKLDGVEVYPSSLNIKYEFGYMLNYAELPFKGLFAPIDHWGYYNHGYTNIGQYGVIPNHDGLGFTYNGGSPRDGNGLAALVTQLTSIKKSDGSEITYEYGTNQGNIFDPATSTFSSSVFGGAGLRIEKISIFDGINHQNDMVKKFEYKKDNGQASGTIFCKPVYSKQFWCKDHGQTTYLLDYSLAQSFGFKYKGSSCGYSTVSVVYGNNGEGGKEVYNFSNIVEPDGTKNVITGIDNLVPFTNCQYTREWRIGLLKNKKVFAYQQSIPKLEELYEYQFSEGELQPVSNYASVKFELKEGLPSGITQNNQNETFDWYMKEYRPWRGRSRMVKKTAISLADDGNFITDITETEFDTYGNPKVAKATNSKGDLIETRMYRSYDYSNSSSTAINHLNSNNRGATVIRTDNLIQKFGTTQKNLTGVKISNYALSSAVLNGQLPVVNKTYSLYSENPVSETSIPFNPNQVIPAVASIQSFVDYSYKNNGYLNSENVKGNVQSLLYSGLNLIATAQNAREQDIAYSSFESENSEGYWTYSGGSVSVTDAYTGRRSFSGETYVNRDLDITKTFEISFWAKGGAVSVYVNAQGPGSGGYVGLNAYETHNGWTLYKGIFSGKSACKVIAAGMVDELRLYPRGAQMNTISYDPLNGPISKCNENNKAIHIEYNELGQTILIRDQDRNIVRKIDYAIQKPE